MSFIETLLNKKNNKAHIKFLVVSTSFLALVSFGIYTLFTEKYETILTNAQVEKEQLVVVQLTKLIDIGFSSEKKNIYNVSIEKSVSDAGLSYLLITDDNDSVLTEINYSGLSKKDSTELTEQEYKYSSNDVFQLEKTFIASNSQEFKLFCVFSRSDLNLKIQKSKTEIGIISLFIFTISSLVLFAASLIIMLPLQKISNYVGGISSGNLTGRVDNKNKNEFSKILSSVNALAESLRKKSSQVEKLNKELNFQIREKNTELNYEIDQKGQAETRLKQSEEQFKLLFEMSPIGMVISSIHGKIVKVNVALLTTLGYTENEILEKNIKDLTYLEDQSTDDIIHEKLIQDIQQSAYYEKRMLRKDGHVIFVIVEAVIVKDKEGKPSHIIEQVIDPYFKYRKEISNFI